MRTLSGLVTAPGQLVDDYVSGKRRAYVNPARFCLLSLALWLLFARVLEVDLMDSLGINVTDKSEGGKSEISERIKNLIASNLDLFLYLTLPIQAFLYKAFFRKSGRNVAETLVLVLYIAGFGYLIGLALTPFAQVGLGWVVRFRALFALIWSIRAARTFFDGGWFSTIWRVLAVTVLHMLAIIITFIGVAVPWVVLTQGSS